MKPREARRTLTLSSLRRRFQHNQEDCTITVLELLPTLSENIIEALPSEKILEGLQQKKAQRLGRSAGTSDVDFSSGSPSTVDEDGRSISSESYVHASQMAASSAGNGESRLAKSKAQLWGELKISCACLHAPFTRWELTLHSNYESIHSTLHSLASKSADTHPTEPTRPKKLSLKCCSLGLASSTRSYNQSGKSR